MDLGSDLKPKPEVWVWWRTVLVLSPPFSVPHIEANMHIHSAPLFFDLPEFWNNSLPELLEESSRTEQGLGAFISPQALLVSLGSAHLKRHLCVPTRWPTEWALETLPCSVLCYWTALALQEEGSSEKTEQICGKRVNSFLEEGRNPTIKENEWIKESKRERESEGKPERSWGSNCYLFSYN